MAIVATMNYLFIKIKWTTIIAIVNFDENHLKCLAAIQLQIFAF